MPATSRFTRLAAFVSAAFVALALAHLPARAAIDLPDGFAETTVRGLLRYPTGIAFLPDGRVLVTESKLGRLLVITRIGATGTVGTPDSVNADFVERGLLGVAVDPGWPARPYLYLFHDAFGGTVWIARYAVTGALTDAASTNLALDPASRFLLLRDIPDLQINHNGGTLRFGPDGMLYAALADDGVPCAAQDTVSLRGVILRLDVSGLPDLPGGTADKAAMVPADNPFAARANPNLRLVWGLGLRNPFRFHIDPLDGTLIIGDVGQAKREELDVCDAPAMNFGWPFYEGTTSTFLTCGALPPGLAAPIHEIARGGGMSAIIAGPVYRGAGGPCAFPAEYAGDLFYAEHYDGVIHRLRKTGATWDFAPPVPGQPSANDWARTDAHPADFAVDAEGALWYVHYATDDADATGALRRICVEQPPAAVDPAAGSGVSFAAPWPSPARGSVSLGWTLARPARVALAIHDLAGRRIRALVPEAESPAGSRVVTWDGRDDDGAPAPAGLYVARLRVDGEAFERPIPFLR